MAGLIVQYATPPYVMMCRTCGKQWTPAPSRSGKNKGQVTDSTLDRSAADHWKECTG